MTTTTADFATAEWICGLPEALFERAVALLGRLRRAQAAALTHFWGFWERAGQRAPTGDWRTWLVMAGRGYGKTRMGAEWVCAQAEADGAVKIALIGATLIEVRKIMIEGDGGILSIGDPATRPRFEPSLNRLTWPNGAQAFVYSAAEPESLRGPQHDFAWCDEIAKWPKGEDVWDNLAMTMRRGERPRIMATTTPRAVPLLCKLAGQIGRGVAVTRGSSRENAGHLAPGYIDYLETHYGGTRRGREEVDGELIEDVADALWTRARFDEWRVAEMPVPAVRVVVAVDPPAGTVSGVGGDACGIVVVALGSDRRGYVLADRSVEGARPERWAAAVADAAVEFGADRVVAERNQGGAMVTSVLRAAGRHLPIREVTATRGKVARAEPVSALYERGCVSHVGALKRLEDELAGLVPGGGYEGPGRSPDRADALVWALTELMLGVDAAAVRLRGL